MTDNSYAAQAVARGPMTIAPPSFDGVGWLVVANMWTLTAGFLIALMMVLLLGTDWWRYRRQDPLFSPAWLWRLTGMFFAVGITLRCGGGALELWGWNPEAPAATGRFLFVKRLMDPVAVSFGMAGLLTFAFSMPGMLRSLRRVPFPVPMWQSWPILRRMGWLALLSLAAAAAVVSLR